MGAIFDAPVTAPPSQELRRIGARARDARDGILGFDMLSAVAPRGARQAASLSRAGPLQMFNARGGLQTACDVSAMFFVARFADIDPLVTQSFVRRGKKPA